MAKEEIIIEIEPDGETTVSVKGVAGTGCKDLTRDIEEALGEAKSSVHTPEWQQRTRITNRPRQQQSA